MKRSLEMNHHRAQATVKARRMRMRMIQKFRTSNVSGALLWYAYEYATIDHVLSSVTLEITNKTAKFYVTHLFPELVSSVLYQGVIIWERYHLQHREHNYRTCIFWQVIISTIKYNPSVPDIHWFASDCTSYPTHETSLPFVGICSDKVKMMANMIIPYVEKTIL